jgi:hypothetical protein
VFHKFVASNTPSSRPPGPRGVYPRAAQSADRGPRPEDRLPPGPNSAVDTGFRGCNPIGWVPKKSLSSSFPRSPERPARAGRPGREPRDFSHLARAPACEFVKKSKIAGSAHCVLRHGRGVYPRAARSADPGAACSGCGKTLMPSTAYLMVRCLAPPGTARRAGRPGGGLEPRTALTQRCFPHLSDFFACSFAGATSRAGRGFDCSLFRRYDGRVLQLDERLIHPTGHRPAAADSCSLRKQLPGGVRPQRSAKIRI